MRIFQLHSGTMIFSTENSDTRGNKYEEISDASKNKNEKYLPFVYATHSVSAECENKCLSSDK